MEIFSQETLSPQGARRRHVNQHTGAITQNDCNDEGRTGGIKSLFRIPVGKTSFCIPGLQMTRKISEGKVEKR